MIDDRIRPGEPGDLDGAADVLAAAFADYAWTRHTVAADDHVRRVRDLQRLFVGRIGLPHGRVWVADGLEGVVAAAVWTTPESSGAEAAFAELAESMPALAGDRTAAAISAEQALAPHRPAGPVWFLATVEVHPALQGKGLGRAIVEPGLMAADAAGVPAFLETSEPANVPFYRKLGFEVTAEVELPDGGPRTWAFRREPRR
ncbi:GNAT family N-acetyltransferase [Amycolatopsis sp. TNS106]|uniref:GNAT family N-acetyltransferase n=1 Tax=Amycolatopsis sp. TNS106 TaxID=2861750 RepID=UPI001C5880A2|nr:GNAT family N-acetyltransferase [Amycolatopsis sp. TNS106]QXV56066.1 N-acetyltransferase [Amycolatopsis sp. TNS106]